VEGFKERYVLLLGTYDKVANATLDVCKLIQSDPHLAEHNCLKYEIKLPIGIWEDSKADSYPATPLMTPEEARFCTKRELLEYLRMSAPRRFLIRHGLLGNINNRVKCKGREEFISAVADVMYLARQGQLSTSANDNANLAAAEAAAELDSLRSLDTSNCDTKDWLSDGTASDSLSNAWDGTEELVIDLQDMDFVDSLEPMTVVNMSGCSDSFASVKDATGGSTMTLKGFDASISTATTCTDEVPLACGGMMRQRNSAHAMLAAARDAQLTDCNKLNENI
jgi:hypothetical protein